MKRSARILFVDDNEDNITVFTWSLAEAAPHLIDCQIECVPVGDGETACRIAREEGPFDLVTTDYNLPRYDGRAIIQFIRSGQAEGPRGTGRTVPIILRSANPRNRAVGEDHFLCTPCEPLLYLKTVAALLELPLSPMGKERFARLRG